MPAKTTTPKKQSSAKTTKSSKLKVNIVKQKNAVLAEIGEDEDKIMPRSKTLKIAVIDEEADQETETVAAEPAPQTIEPRQAGATVVSDDKDSRRLSKQAVVDLSKHPDPAAPQKERPATGLVHLPKSLSIYKKIALIFALLVSILFGIVFYTNMVKVKITIVTAEEKISTSVLLDVYQENTVPLEGRESIRVFGNLGRMTVADEKKYPATGEKPLNEEVKGTATIYNNYIKSQPLVASTRLLTPDNKLFRISETVNVPAGGSVEVEIYADEASEAMAIEPTKLSIPGLWAGLQDKIYAQTEEPLKLARQVKHFILQADLDNANKDLREKLVERAKADMESRKGDYDQLLYQLDEDSIASEIIGSQGDETDEFYGKISAEIYFVSFKSEESQNAIEGKLAASMPENKKVMQFAKDSITYTLDNCDVEQGTASISAAFESRVALKGEGGVVDKQKILGLSRDQLQDYLAQIPEIASYTITFQPSFIKRVPNLADNIEVVISN